MRKVALIPVLLLALTLALAACGGGSSGSGTTASGTASAGNGTSGTAGNNGTAGNGGTAEGSGAEGSGGGETPGGAEGSGGGEGSGGAKAGEAAGGTKVSGNPAEAAWAKEATAVLSRFENNVSATIVSQINETSNKVTLEPLYRTWSGYLANLTKELEATHAPQSCLAKREEIAGYAHRAAELTRKLGHQPGLSQQEFAVLLFQQGQKIDTVGRKLGVFATKPGC